ncbi:hypothetical protein GFC01_11955 [Desulfofundulus thermobenzoicus]|uniref:Uncharacterized protein n=1 Tax=Desulfofundulus thermobenzoicus TaxID=29376 RepID=A0A6N7ISP6_9FIRM|nr:hypothetical protein [Desulfofundulus thermobenzoicus]MQL52961.1 hypothetical protein [Desulfofundulus thermobenzoicus]
MIKIKDMTREQITHTFCSWCDYRRVVAGETCWVCGLDEQKLEELCAYRQALRRETEKAGQSCATH